MYYIFRKVLVLYVRIAVYGRITAVPYCIKHLKPQNTVRNVRTVTVYGPPTIWPLPYMVRCGALNQTVIITRFDYNTGLSQNNVINSLEIRSASTFEQKREALGTCRHERDAFWIRAPKAKPSRVQYSLHAFLFTVHAMHIRIS